jgi:hypothetical protein
MCVNARVRACMLARGESESIAGSRRQTADSRQQAADSRQQTTDSRQHLSPVFIHSNPNRRNTDKREQTTAADTILQTDSMKDT